MNFFFLIDCNPQVLSFIIINILIHIKKTEKEKSLSMAQVPIPNPDPVS